MKKYFSKSNRLNCKVIDLVSPIFSETMEKLRGKTVVAYSSMEYGIKDELPLYSGGLGVLAGDSLKSAADLHIPMVALGILWKEGYFTQQLLDGEQQYQPQIWDPHNVENLHLTDKVVSLDIQDLHRNTLTIKLKVWRYDVISADGSHVVPLYLLDADHPDNADWMKRYTRQLYDSKDPISQIVQRYILGAGGMRLMDVLEKEYDLKPIYHLNEGHASMAIIEYHNLYEADQEKMEDMQNRFTFTIHTPVDAAMDRLQHNDLYHVLPLLFAAKMIDFSEGSTNPKDRGCVNMPYMAMKHSRAVNGVAELHGIVTKQMFPDFVSKISHITNGVYTGPGGWQAPEIQKVLDNYIIGTDWHENPEALADLKGFLKGHEQLRHDLHQTHLMLKGNFIDYLNQNSDGVNIYPANGPDFDKEWLTIGFARRFAPYKRANLLFYDMDKLTELLHENHKRYKGKGIQMVFAGKSHPNDGGGKAIIKDLTKTIDEVNAELGGEYMRLKFIVNYNMEKAMRMISSVDYWLNNPMSPMEASGTSGMKAAHNGIPQISTPDGWWPETVHNAGITFGTYIPNRNEDQLALSYIEDSRLEIKAMRTATEIFYTDFTEMIDMRINAIFGNGAFFNTHRQEKEYLKMWGMKSLKG